MQHARLRSRISCFIVLLATLLTSVLSATASAAPSGGSWKQVYSSDFSDGKLDSSVWKTFDGTSGTNPLDHYSSKNVSVSGDMLRIYSSNGTTGNIMYTGPQGKYYSFSVTARVIYSGAGDNDKYQYIMAILLFPGSGSTGPGKHLPEYDMAEAPGAQYGRVQSNLHYLDATGKTATSSVTTTANPQQWHTYSIAVSPAFVRYRIDGNLVDLPTNVLPDKSEFLHIQEELHWSATKLPASIDRSQVQVSQVTVSTWVPAK